MKIMYELITCFHEFYSYKSTIFFTKFYLFIFLRGSYGKNADVTVNINKKTHFAAIKKKAKKIS